MSAAELPIGVFDSGVGGLTVLRALQRTLPCESVLYLGDTARVPYGTKSPESVVRYALQAADLLVGRGIKLLAVACKRTRGTGRLHLMATDGAARFARVGAAFLGTPIATSDVELVDV